MTDLPPISLDDPIGNNSRYGGPVESLTLRQWLEGDNRKPQYRARQMALTMIERQAVRLRWLEIALANAQGGEAGTATTPKSGVVHEHPVANGDTPKHSR